jgi:hypothetical protein
MIIQNVEIENTKPLEDGAFCHYPKNTFHHINGSLDDFKRAERRKLDSSYLQYERLKALRQSREQSEKSNRLVITRKSPTADNSLNKRETSLRIYHRQWSGEYRVSVESFTRLQQAPPPQSGERLTIGLTPRSASKIKDAGAYVAACKGGFKTFCTLTFTIEQRLQLSKGETTIGKEAARFFDALQKKITRGWTWQPAKNQLEGLQAPVRIEGRKHKLNYIWVAESPDKKDQYTTPEGEIIEVTTGVNPHIHFLMDWGVERELFPCWAAQIESIWGNGTAHLEKIRNPKSAVGYMLKALGYMTKGAAEIDKETGEIINSQGMIKGNRYGISKDARAPDWECINEFEAAHMGQIVREMGQRICIESDAIKARIISERAIQDKQKATIKKLNLANYAAKLSKAAIDQRKQAATTLLAAASAKVSGLIEMTRKMDYSNCYKITFRARETLDTFLKYAILKREWKATPKKHTTKKVVAFEPIAGVLVTMAPNPQTQSINDWAKKVHENLELYWGSLMSDVDNQSNLMQISI